MQNDENVKLYMKIQPLIMEDIRRETQKSVTNAQFTVAKNPFHTHNRVDSLPVSYSDLTDKIMPVTHTIYGTSAATAGNYGVFFTAYQACLVVGFSEVHQTAGTDGGAVTLQLEKLTSGVAPDSGTVLLTTALSLKSTANTPQNGTIINSADPSYKNLTTYLGVGDRLCLKDAGVLTSVNNVTVVVKLLLIP